MAKVFRKGDKNVLQDRDFQSNPNAYSTQWYF